MSTSSEPGSPGTAVSPSRAHYFRFHLPHVHLGSTFGDGWFALKAEAFARFFGTPVFLVIQTVIVAIWILANVLGLAKFDLYPFILLNLAFSLQAAYAAPLILLAQTRQADRDKAHAEADAQHREALASAVEQRQALRLETDGAAPDPPPAEHGADRAGQGSQPPDRGNDGRDAREGRERRSLRG